MPSIKHSTSEHAASILAFQLLLKFWLKAVASVKRPVKELCRTIVVSQLLVVERDILLSITT